MAEQDRKDAVPSVLNDLIDVDGEAAEGDVLRRGASAWTPYGGMVGMNPHGPRGQAFSCEVTGWTNTEYGDTMELTSATTDITDVFLAITAPFYDVRGGSFCSIVDVGGGGYGLQIDEPGIYGATAQLDLQFNTNVAVSDGGMVHWAWGYGLLNPGTNSNDSPLWPFDDNMFLRTTVPFIYVAEDDVVNGNSTTFGTGFFYRETGSTLHVTEYTILVEVYQIWPGLANTPYGGV